MIETFVVIAVVVVMAVLLIGPKRLFSFVHLFKSKT